MADYALSTDTEEGGWIRTEYRNLHFLNIKLEGDDHTVYNADVFLGLTSNEEKCSVLVL
jgi:hypothetical protein